MSQNGSDSRMPDQVFWDLVERVTLPWDVESRLQQGSLNLVSLFQQKINFVITDEEAAVIAANNWQQALLNELGKQGLFICKMATEGTQAKITVCLQNTALHELQQEDGGKGVWK